MTIVARSVTRGPQWSSLLELRHASTDHAIFVEVPTRRFVAIDGIGSPLGADFMVASRALRDTHATVLDELRWRRLHVPISRTLPECLWQRPSGVEPSDVPVAFADLSRWRWRQLIELPATAPDDLIRSSIDAARRNTDRAVSLIRPWSFAEGRVAQILHVGGRTGMADSIRRLHAALEEAGYEPIGALHELILVDGVAVPDDRARAIIRQPLA